MSKKLFEVECKVYVWAEDAQDAQDIAQREGGRNEEWEAWETDSVDSEWRDALPYRDYSDGPDLTCGQLIEQVQEAELERRREAERRKLQLPLPLGEVRP